MLINTGSCVVIEFERSLYFHREGHGILTVKAAFEYALTWSGEWYQVTKTGA